MHDDERIAGERGRDMIGRDDRARQLERPQDRARRVGLVAQEAAAIAHVAHVGQDRERDEERGDDGRAPRQRRAARELGREQQREDGPDIDIPPLDRRADLRSPQRGRDPEGEEDREQRGGARRDRPAAREPPDQDRRCRDRERAAPAERLRVLSDHGPAETRERAQDPRRGVGDEAGRDDHVVPDELRLLVGQPPGGVDRERRRDDPRVAEPPAPVSDLDHEPGGDREPDAGARERERQQRAGACVAGTIAAIEQQQGADARPDRQQVADLERPEDVLPRGAEQQQERRRQQREEAADAAARVFEQQHDAGEMRDYSDDAVRQVVVEPGRAEQQPVERQRDERQVLVVRLEPGVRVGAAAIERPQPLVDPESRRAVLVEDEGRAGGQQNGESEPCRRGWLESPTHGAGPYPSATMTAGPSENAAPATDAEELLASAPAVRAAGPAPDAGSLRTAYLDLLKLCLCDLTGATTQSVGALPDGVAMARELSGDGRRLRAAGMDWPLQGLTMVGLTRLDDLQRCVETVVRDGVEGDAIEAGAWRGGAAILMRATLDSLGEDRTVCVADSFSGFPEDGSTDLSAFGFLAVPLEEVRESFARLGCERGVEFVPGYFEDSLRGLADRRWAIVRLDADTYEPTRAALRALYPGLAAGGVLIVDDYGSFEGARRAVDEFRDEHGIEEPLERLAGAEAQIGLRPWLRRRLGRGVPR